MIVLLRDRAKDVKIAGIVGQRGGSAADRVTRVAVGVDLVARAARAVATAKVVPTAKVAVVIANVVVVTARAGQADSHATTVHVAGRAATVEIAPSAVTAASVVASGAASATLVVRHAGEVASAIAMRVGFRAPHASAMSGASALIASATPVVRAATPNELIPAHRRLDRSDRRCDVQREERRTHTTR